MLRRFRPLVLAPLAGAFLTTSLSAQSLDRLRDEARQEVVGMAKLSQEIVDMIFSFSELGFQEKWTAEYVTGLLRDEGFTIQMGAAGMPTGYIASWGSGSPVVGIMGDIDGLPETSQKPGVAYHDPLIPGGPGHGEGHNSAPAVDVVAAIATKRIMERHGLPGTIKVIPGVAEELVFGEEKITTGAGNDIERATAIARRMVTQFGMSPAVGPVTVGDREHEIFLGREFGHRREVSEKTAQLVDSEIKRILDEAYSSARTVLKENRDLLETIAEALLERETLDADEIKLVDEGKPLPPLPSGEPVRGAPEEASEERRAVERKPQESGGGEPSPALA